ncbi:hypothetical protein CHUAL_001481 [Chamberlinius hualienensis]
MASTSGLQDVRFHIGKDVYHFQVTRELSNKMKEDKEWAISYLKQMLKQQSEPQNSKIEIEPARKKPNTGQISVLQIPIKISNEGGAVVSHHQWPVEAAKLLLHEYKSKLEDFNGGIRKKKDVWLDIHQALRSYGYAFSQETCEKKFRNMKSSYLAIRERNLKLGRNTSKWEFYDEMEEIFGDCLSDTKIITVITNDNHQQEKVDVDVDVDENNQQEDAEIVNDATTINYVEPTVSSLSTSSVDQPPSWFSLFLKEFHQAEEKKLEQLKQIHQDNLQLLQQRNVLLEKLNQTIEKLIQ